MKRYRLLKNTPIAPKGEIFGEYVRNGDTYLMWLDKNGAEHLTEFRKATIFNFDEWFKEIKEFEEWRPKHGEGFKVMNIDGSVTDYYDWADSESDRFLLGTGNCYPLNTPDELIIKERKLIPQAMHRLKMAAKKAWFEFNGSEGPDWSNRLQEKWKLSYDHSTDIFLSTVNRIEQFGNLPCFPTEESAQWVIDNLQDELKLVMGIKD